MFRNILRPDSPLMITMTQITDCIFLSLFWLLGCFPIFTAGASTAALYDAVYHGFRQGEKHTWQRFWGSFKANFRSSLVPALVFWPLSALLVQGMVRCWNLAVGGRLSWMLFASAMLVAVLLAGILSVLFPLLSRFENTTARLLKNTVLLAMANMPRTLVLGILNCAAVLLCAAYVFPLFFLPALASLLSTWLLEPMFRPFLPKPEGED